MKNKLIYKLVFTLLIISNQIYLLSAQNQTNVSLFLKSDSSKYLTEISSETGDLFNLLGHHGPAIENEYLGLRIFFNSSTAIDVYSKTKPGLELLEYKWYPGKEEQFKGWGCDMYKVGTTLGLGGIRLWDGEGIVELNPVSVRIAKVVKEDSGSYMELISKGIPYKEDTVDIKVRVSVFSGTREAKVEAEELNGKTVQFVTGVNYHSGNKVYKENNYIAVWGVHPEDVAAVPVDLGAALLYNSNDFLNIEDDGSQVYLISKPTNKLATYISSSNSNEQEINSNLKFAQYLNELIIDLPVVE